MKRKQLLLLLNSKGKSADCGSRAKQEQPVIILKDVNKTAIKKKP